MIIEQLKNKTEESLRKKYGDLTGEVRIAPDPRGEYDFSINTLSLKGVVKADIAEVTDFLIKEFKKAEKNVDWIFMVGTKIEKGYLNFKVDNEKLAQFIFEELKNKKEKFGNNELKKNQEVLVEYPSNNTHKDLHVGHLRNICLSGTIINLIEVSGGKVIPINYVNDFGAHVAKCLWGIKNLANTKQAGENKQQWLGEIYAMANKYLEEHPEKKVEVAIIQQQIENKDESIFELYEQTRQWSLTGFQKIFNELGVVHKMVFYEKDVKDIGQKTVDELLKKGIAKIGEGGAVIVDLSEYNLDVALLRKSDGAGLYLTSDLGLAQAKNKKYPKVDESVHITGIEQNFYFQQLFKILELAGFNYKMKHIGYGLVSRPEGKMSSRSGNVLLYEDLRDQVIEKVMEETRSRHPDWEEKKMTDIVRAIAMSAIKFEFLKHEANKNLVFDINQAVSFDGFTGPYVLYTVARINSLLKKGKIFVGKKIDYALFAEAEAKKIFLMIGELDGVIKKAMENYNPSVIVKYSFDLSRAFNDFYNKYAIVDKQEKYLSASRLTLAITVKTVLEKALKIIKISSVEEM
jgi:arginyl-tRNA synthetase